MKVLITGANGQLGGELVEAFHSWQVVPTDQDNLDITDLSLTNKIISKEKPDWIIHCAAWTDVEGCAENPEKAMFINGEGTKNLAQAAKAVGAKLLYISTNEVFDGTKSNPYLEDEKTEPINPYAVSKLAGEKFVQEILGGDGVVVRTSWVYGPKGHSNFPLKIIAAARNNGALKVTSDEYSSPTYAPDLAKAIFDLIQKEPAGIFHLINEGSCSRYEWAKKILEFAFINVPIEETSLTDYPRKSTPPPRSVLENTRAKGLGVVLPKWEESLKTYIKIISEK